MTDQTTEMFKAIEKGNPARLQEAIVRGADLESVNESGDTPLLHAIRRKRLSAVAALLEAGAEPNHTVRLGRAIRADRGKDIKDESPLSLSIVNLDIPAIKLLLEHKADIANRPCEAAACLSLCLGHKRAENVVSLLLDHGLNPKSMWKGLRLYRMAENRPALRAKLEALGEKMTPTRQNRKVSPAPRSSSLHGASDLIDFIHEWGHPEWTVFAVQALLQTVTETYASINKTTSPLRNVELRPARKKDDTIAPFVAIVRPKNCRWTVILETLCLPMGLKEAHRAAATCKQLSAKLRTRALHFQGEDTSYAMGYTLYSSGKQIDEHEWEDQTQFSDDEFKSLGIYLPACYPAADKVKSWLAIAPKSRDRVEQADLVPL